MAPLGLFSHAHLGENILHFVRVLRKAGLPVGPAKVIAAMEAVEAVGIENREDFRAALESVLIERHEQQVLFDQAFELFWRNPQILERMLQLLLPKVYGRVPRADAEAPLPSRLAEAMAPPPRASSSEADEQEIDLDATLSFSSREVLQTKDFETMTTAELAQVKSMIARLRLPLPELPTRRTRPAIAEPKSTFAPRCAPWRPHAARSSRSPGGGAARDARRWSCSATSPGRWIAMHACCSSSCMPSPIDRDRVHTLLFGTRLTNITRHLRQRDVDVAIARNQQRGVGLGGRDAHRRMPRRVQPPLVAPPPGTGRDRAADHRRPRQRRRRRALAGDGSAEQVVPAPDLAQSRCCATSSSRRGPRASVRCCRMSTNFCRCTIWRA